MVLMACSSPRPTSAHPISKSGPTASKSGFAVRASNEWVGDVEGEGGEAGEDEQSAGWPKLIGGRAVEGEVPGAEQEAEDGQVDRGRDQWRHPGRDAQSKREVEDVAEAEEEGEANDGAHDDGNCLYDGSLIRA
jgi:hypothetical protein